MGKSIDLEMFRGDTKTFDVFATKPDPTIGTPTPIDLTAAKIWFTAKRTPTDADLNAVVALVSTGSGITVVSAAAGQMRIAVPGASTNGLPDDPISLLYAVKVREASGVLTTVQSGALLVRPSAARAIV